VRKLVLGNERLDILNNLHRDHAHQVTPDVAPNSGGLVRRDVELQDLPSEKKLCVMTMPLWPFVALYVYVLVVGTQLADFLFTEMH